MVKQQTDLMNTKQRKSRDKKIIEYYFSNPENNGLGNIAEEFEISIETVRKAVDKEMKLRLENSLSRRCARY
jgi:DNA-directed RNA polymerase sigma subunit (sigma70/sigma32)